MTHANIAVSSSFGNDNDRSVMKFNNQIRVGSTAALYCRYMEEKFEKKEKGGKKQGVKIADFRSIL